MRILSVNQPVAVCYGATSYKILAIELIFFLFLLYEVITLRYFLFKMFSVNYNIFIIKDYFRQYFVNWFVNGLSKY